MSGRAIFPTFALTNHSCAPNCAWTCGVEPPNTNKMELRAIRNIKPEEEVTKKIEISTLRRNWSIDLKEELIIMNLQVTVSYTMVECRSLDKWTFLHCFVNLEHWTSHMWDIDYLTGKFYIGYWVLKIGHCRFSCTLERQNRLKEGWAFVCNCTICTTGPTRTLSISI